MAKQTAAPPKSKPETPPTPPAKTPEELAKIEGEKPVESPAIDNFTSRFIRPGDKTPKPAPAKKVEKPAPAAAKPKLATPPPPAAPRMSEAEIAETAARIAVEATRPKPAEAPKPEDATAKLPEADQKRIAVLQRLEKSSPEKYKGLAERYQKSLTSFAEYAEKWEAAHPGETFDEDAEEHKEFRDGNEKDLDWDDDEYTEALTDLKFEKRFEEVEGRNKAQTDQAKRIQDELPVIEELRKATNKSFLEKFGTEYAAIVDDKGVVVKEAWEKLEAADPVKTEIIISSADLVEKMAVQIHALFKGLFPFNTQNPIHRTVSGFMLQQEAKILREPADKQRNADGLPFVTRAKYLELPEDKRKTVWTFGSKDCQVLIVNAIYKQTKEKLDFEDQRFEKRAKARGINLNSNGAAPHAPAAPAPKQEAEAEVEDEKPETPDVPVQPRAPSGGAPQNDAPADRFAKKFIGG